MPDNEIKEQDDWMFDNPFGLSPQELSVLKHWRKSGNMTEAYKEVMLSMYDKQAIKAQALNKRVHRFFATYRIREAMASCPGKLGEKAKKDFEKWCENQKNSAIKRFKRIETNIDNHTENELSEEEQAFASVQTGHMESPIINDTVPQNESHIVELDSINENAEESEQDGTSFQQPQPERKKYRPDSPTKGHVSLLSTLATPQESQQKPIETDRETWMKSLNINKDPSAMTVYGTGQFIMYMAVKEIMDRKDEIKRRGKTALDRDGSVFTQTLISAIKTAAAMIIPFAPAPTADDRREMSKAAVLLGLLPDKIEEDPDAYTAEPPAVIDL